MLTLKKLEVSAGLSEETLAFGCEVYWKGRRIAFAKNRGNGEMTHLTPIGSTEDFVAASKFAETKPWCEPGGEHMKDVHGNVMYHTLDSLVDDLAEEMDHKKRIKRNLSRGCKAKTIFIDGDEVRRVDAPLSDRVIKFIRSKHPRAVILNEMVPEQAVQLWYEADLRFAAATM